MKYIITVSLLLCCVIQMHAQLDSLQHYLSIAEANNPQLQAQHNHYLSTVEKIHQVGVLPDPQLEAGVFVQPMETLMGKQYATIKLMQMFPWFGTLSAAKDEAQYMAQMELYIWHNIRQEITYNVQKEYFTLYTLQQEIDITGQTIELLRRIEQTAIYNYEADKSRQVSTQGRIQNTPLPSPTPSTNIMNSMNMGNINSTNTTNNNPMQGMPSAGGMDGLAGNKTMSDILHIRIEAAEWENTLLGLNDQMEIQKIRFNSLLNRNYTIPIALPDSLPVPMLIFDEQTIIDSMRQNHPMLQMYKSEAAKNEAKLKMNRRMGMPMIGVGVEYMPVGASIMAMPDMNGKDMVMPMVSFNIPIYRGKYKAQQREISYLQQTSDANAANTSNMIMIETKEALRLYKEASRWMRLYKAQQTLLEHNLNLLLSQYSVGENNIVEILRAEQQLLDYKIKLVKASADMHTAKAWIEKLYTK